MLLVHASKPPKNILRRRDLSPDFGDSVMAHDFVQAGLSIFYIVIAVLRAGDVVLQAYLAVDGGWRSSFPSR